MTTLLEKADTEYRRIRARRQHLREEEARLRKELPKAHAQGRDQDQEHDIGNRLRAIAEELQLTHGPYVIAERRAREVAAQQITSSAAYHRAVRDAAQGLGEALPPLLALEALIAEARHDGVGLPVSVVALLAEAKLWATRAITAGALDRADASALRELVEG